MLLVEGVRPWLVSGISPSTFVVAGCVEGQAASGSQRACGLSDRVAHVPRGPYQGDTAWL